VRVRAFFARVAKVCEQSLLAGDLEVEKTFCFFLGYQKEKELF